MDIEGYEIEALKGMQSTLSTFRPIFFFEWSQNKINSEIESCEALFPENYTFYLFRSQIPKYMFFQAQGYRLEKLTTNWFDGNLLAVPNERIEQIARCNA